MCSKNATSQKHIYSTDMKQNSSFGRIVTACRQSKYATFYLFCLFAFSLFMQCMLFHWAAFHSIMVSSLWKNPAAFWSYYLPKIGISFFLAAFVFLTRRKGWTIVVSLLVNVWIIAELIYYRSTRIFIGAHSFLLLGNMDGFWDCLPMYMDAYMGWLLVPTLLTILAVYLFHTEKHSLLGFAVVLTVSLIADMTTCNLYQHRHHFYFCSLQESFIDDIFRSDINERIPQNLSALHAFAYDMKHLGAIPFEKKPHLTEEELSDIALFIQPYNTVTQPATPLVLILVESLETWAIRPDITPNLCRFIDQHPSVLHATRVKSQTKGGQSGDGQMIFNTGLLPVAEGAACNRFANHVFPSLSEPYERTAMIQPGTLSIWNQYNMNLAYHIDTAYLNSSSRDARTFTLLDSIATHYDYILAITMATHTPFEASSTIYPVPNLPTDMPTAMANYLHSLHYTDSCWGAFLLRIDTDSTLHNTTIGIMGDHIIFNPAQRQEFQTYCDKTGLDFTPQEAYTTLVVYSPTIQEKTVIDTLTYQMDAYPTLLHRIGGEAYYWQGFGADLLDTSACAHRPLTEPCAYQLSDKLIQADYFR